ncbi:hypothetical protein SCHPADRAFT_422244 [Schizopora paradoxa]|uniref:Uncharacterized protein n=1 Tax=Schizopora paradoxa TaxID=27342 RepID=A0A0H2RKG1_9AGAM|nr:hypothetical protein SCHPADRAFT_422244 [Schizopora paradoxa]
MHVLHILKTRSFLKVAALGIIVSGIVGITAEINASKISSDLAAKKRELVDLESRLKALQELGPVIERSLADMGYIGEKLTILSEVWKAVRSSRPSSFNVVIDSCLV